MRAADVVTCIFLGVLAPPPPAAAAVSPGPAEAASDAYLRGYVVSWLEQTMRMGPERVNVEVRDGVVTLTGFLDSPEEIDRVVTTIGSFAGVVRVVNHLEVETGTPRRRWRIWTDWHRPPPGRGTWSPRFGLFHQSPHPGDEFLLQPQDVQPVPRVTRITLSYEAIELLGSYERDGGRLYLGSTHIVAIDPSGLGRNRLQVGAEYRGNPVHWRTSRIIAGLDVQAWNETRWDRDASAKAGLMFKSPYGDARSLELLVEYYRGHAPHGQFFPVRVEYFGLGAAYMF